MSDIVDRIRDYKLKDTSTATIHDLLNLMYQAANEIGILRNRVKRLEAAKDE